LICQIFFDFFCGFFDFFCNKLKINRIRKEKNEKKWIFGENRRKNGRKWLISGINYEAKITNSAKSFLSNAKIRWKNEFAGLLCEF
jgi:hypothetical protein